MSLKRTSLRVAAVLPAGLPAACTQQEIEKGIEDATKDVLAAIGKVILISLGLLLAWAAAAAIGGSLIALGVRRRKLDAGAVLLILAGGGIVVAAWPLVFSQSGLAGVWAPGSTSNVTAGPVVGQVIAVAVAVIVALVMVRRHRKRAATRSMMSPLPTPEPAVPPPSPPPPPSASRVEAPTVVVREPEVSSPAPVRSPARVRGPAPPLPALVLGKSDR